MDILLAILLVLIAWFIFKSLWAIIVVAITVAIVVGVVRYIRSDNR